MKTIIGLLVFVFLFTILLFIYCALRLASEYDEISGFDDRL